MKGYGILFIGFEEEGRRNVSTPTKRNDPVDVPTCPVVRPHGRTQLDGVECAFSASGCRHKSMPNWLVCVAIWVRPFGKWVIFLCHACFLVNMMFYLPFVGLSFSSANGQVTCPFTMDMLIHKPTG